MAAERCFAMGQHHLVCELVEVKSPRPSTMLLRREWHGMGMGMDLPCQATPWPFASPFTLEMEQRYPSTQGGRTPSLDELGCLQGHSAAKLPFHGHFPAASGGSCRISVSQLPLQ